MRFKQLTEAEKQGSFIGVKLTKDSNARLVGWMDQNLIKNPEPADELHVTLVLRKEGRIPYHPINYNPPVPVDPKTYSIDLFGKENNVMVLRFESEFFQNRHHKLRDKYDLSWDFPDYAPHITLTKEIQEIATELEPPTFELEFDREYLEAFDSDETD